MDGVEAATKKRRRYRLRSGRCYELAGKYLLDDPTWTLVHGTARGRDGRIGHAWLVRGDTVYDATLDKSFPRANYVARYAADAVTTYNAIEAARAMLVSRHWGPW